MGVPPGGSDGCVARVHLLSSMTHAPLAAKRFLDPTVWTACALWIGDVTEAEKLAAEQGVMVARQPREQSAITEDMKAAAEAQIVEQSRHIDFYLTEYSVELLASKMHAGEFEVPGYQREFT